MSVINKPNFLCVGAQKAGTTSMYDILKGHPDIYLPDIKETKFFQDTGKYSQGIEFYKKEFFSKCKNEKAIGEIDPEYMYFDYVTKLIYQTLGKDIKIIFMLRNPASRAYSHYLMSKRRGYDELSFEEAISGEAFRIQEDDSDLNFRSKKNNLSYIDRGRYAEQINRYLEYFPIENMHFILFEDEFIKNRSKCIYELLTFLNVDTQIMLNTETKSNSASEPIFYFLRDMLKSKNIFTMIVKKIIPNNKTRNTIRKFLNGINQKPIDSKLSRELKSKIIQKYYMKDIKKLEKLIDKDLSTWYIK